jgi:hypothetical protein
VKRAERLKRAKAALDRAARVYERATKAFNKVKDRYDLIEASFDAGEAVKVTHTCHRGCCVEDEYLGTVVGIEDNGTWKVQRLNGGISEYVSHYDMKRVANAD